MEKAASERKEIGMDLPEVVSASEWEEAQKRLRSKEKELTGRSDDLAAERRRLPRTRVEKDYEFEGPQGKVGLADLFEGRRQLVLYHFMFGPNQDGEGFALSAFLRDGGDVYRTYFTKSRGVEPIGTVWSFLDRTPFGRQETWEDLPAGFPQGEPYTWWRRHDEYEEER
jgi:predicted dithiol-disulfide oxidoreductase (DUF899 family)